MPFVDDDAEVVVGKPSASQASTSDLETDDCAVDFGDQDALSRAGLERISPSDKKSYVRCAVLTDVVKPRMAWMHFIQNGDKKSPYRCLSKRDKKHNITEIAPCCQKLGKDKDQAAQLVFAVLAVKYINADPTTGKYAPDPATGQAPPVRWELGWLRLSQSGFKSIGELTQEEEQPYMFDFAMRNRESGIGYNYVRVSPKCRFRQNPELMAEVLEEAKKFADGEFLVKQLGKKVTLIDMKAVLSGNAAGSAQAKHSDDPAETF
jgi:hypothetical protein